MFLSSSSKHILLQCAVAALIGATLAMTEESSEIRHYSGKEN